MTRLFRAELQLLSRWVSAVIRLESYNLISKDKWRPLAIALALHSIFDIKYFALHKLFLLPDPVQKCQNFLQQNLKQLLVINIFRMTSFENIIYSNKLIFLYIYFPELIYSNWWDIGEIHADSVVDFTFLTALKTDCTCKQKNPTIIVTNDVGLKYLIYEVKINLFISYLLRILAILTVPFHF